MQYLNKAVFRATSSLKQPSLSKYIASAVHPPVQHISGREQGTTWGIHRGLGVAEAAFPFWKAWVPSPDKSVHVRWDTGSRLFPSHPVQITEGSGTANFAQESVWKCRGRSGLELKWAMRGKILKFAIWKNNSCCRARKRMQTHTEFSRHRVIYG